MLHGVTSRLAARLAWSLAILAMTLVAGSLWISSGREEHSGLFQAVTLGFVAAGFSIVGALVVSRHPSNAIGWIFSAVGLLAGANGFAEAYARRALIVDPGSLPGGVMAAWAQNWMWVPLIGLTSTLSLLLFPDGRLPSRRWRPVLWTSVAAIGAATSGFLIGPLKDEITESIEAYTSPLGVAGTAGQAAEVVGLAGFVLLMGSALVSVASLVARFRRASHVRRQQIKWFAFGGSLLAVVVVVGSSLWQVSPIAQVLVPVSLVLAPTTAGIAILRYRLYDIDVIINRTLVYGALSAALGLAYLGFVTLLQQLLRPVTGSSGFAVAGSTLIVAALFRPVRDRLQAAIDRRFFRHKYDAVRTLETFSARLREEIDLGSLSHELLVIASQTMGPTHLSLWLRDTSEASPGPPPRRVERPLQDPR